MEWMIPAAALPTVLCVGLVPWFSINRRVKRTCSLVPWFLMAVAAAGLLWLVIILIQSSGFRSHGIIMLPWFAIIPTIIAIVSIGLAQPLWRNCEKSVEEKDKRSWLPLLLLLPVVTAPISMLFLFGITVLWPLDALSLWLIGPIAAGCYFYWPRKIR